MMPRTKAGLERRRKRFENPEVYHKDYEKKHGIHEASESPLKEKKEHAAKKMGLTPREVRARKSAKYMVDSWKAIKKAKKPISTERY